MNNIKLIFMNNMTTNKYNIKYLIIHLFLFISGISVEFFCMIIILSIQWMTAYLSIIKYNNKY